MLTRRVFGMRLAAAMAGLAAMVVATRAGGAGRGQGRRVRGGQPEECARQRQRRLEGRHRQGSDDLLRGELGACQADRERRAGRHLHFGRSRLDEISLRQEADQARHRGEAARQPHRAGRADGFHGGDQDRRRISTWPACSATASSPWATSRRCRPANTARRRSNRSASGPRSKPRSRRPKTCAPRSSSSRPARRRSASSTPTDADAEPGVKVVGTFPEDTHPPIVYPVGPDRRIEESRRRRVPEVPAVGEGQGILRGAGVRLPRAGRLELRDLH